MGHRVQRHRRAIAPAPYAYTAAIKLGILHEELIERGELVLQLNRAKLMADGGHELAVAPGSASIIEGKDREPALGQNLMEESGGADIFLNPAIGDELRSRTAVDVYDQRDLAGRCAFWREQKFAVED